MVESVLRQAGLGWPVSEFSTVSRRQKTLTIAIPYRASSEGLHRLVDSTGIKILSEDVMARDFGRQVSVLQVRAAMLNHLTHL